MASSRVLLFFLAMIGSYMSAVESRSFETLGTIEDFKHTSRSKILSSTTEPLKNAAGTEIFGATPDYLDLCSLCKDVTSQAISFLTANETQAFVHDTLHEACSWVNPIFGEQCTELLDEYLPLLFKEVALIRPKKLCKHIGLCDGLTLVTAPKESPCSFCHEVMDEVRLKLDDPETQLEVIKLLLKGCTKLHDLSKECKRLVFRYVPLVLATAEKFLERKDVCIAIHACKAAGQGDSGSSAVLASA